MLINTHGPVEPWPGQVTTDIHMYCVWCMYILYAYEVDVLVLLTQQLALGCYTSSQTVWIRWQSRNKVPWDCLTQLAKCETLYKQDQFRLQTSFIYSAKYPPSILLFILKSQLSTASCMVLC